MLNLRFRPYTPQDYFVLLKFFLHFYQEENIETSEEKLQKTIVRLQQHPENGNILILEQTENLVGYSILINLWSNEHGGIMRIVDELYVTPTHRGKGVASQFFHFLTHDNPNNAVVLALEVQEHNKKALQLYQKVGFELTGRHHLRKHIT